MKIKSLALSLLIICTMAACTRVYKPESTLVSLSAQLKTEPLSKTGNSPYEVYGTLYTPVSSAAGFVQTGISSWYGSKFHGRKTSSGEIYDMYGISAAHKTLPIPSYIKVTNLTNDKSIVVRVNDRGPFIGSRILDLSYGAAKELDFIAKGTTPIKIESIRTADKQSNKLPVQKKPVYLQTGVFSVYANALAAKKALETKGYQVKLEKHQRKLYRIKVGPFSSAKLAYNEKKSLERDGKSKIMLVNESL